VKMDPACPEKDVTEILSDSDHLTKVAPATLRLLFCECELLIFDKSSGKKSLMVYLLQCVVKFDT